MQTSITTQVAIGLALSALLTLAGFGYLAYDTAISHGTRNDEKVLLLLNSDLIEDMQLTTDSRAILDALAIRVTHLPGDEYTALVLDRAGQVVAHNAGPATEADRLERLPLISFLARQPASGHISLAGDHYIWSSRPVYNTQYTFVVLYRISADTHTSYFLALKGPLIFGSVIIIFVSWIAAVIVNARHRNYLALQQRLEDEAMFDQVTGLARSALLEDRLRTALLVARRAGSNFSIICLGLDHLQKVRSHLAAAESEVLLAQFCRIISETVRDSDSLAQLDEDTLVLLLPQTDTSTIQVVARKLLERLSSPLRAGNDTFFIQCHMGAAIFPAHGSSAEDLLAKAQVALRVSRQAHNEFTVYDRDLEEFRPEQLRYINALRRAINEKQLYLLLQPKVDLRTAMLTGAECLIRWRDDKGTEHTPDDFIPVAEQAGLIGSITQWAVDQSLQHCVALHQAGIQIPVSVNISAFCLHDPGFEQMILKELDRGALDPSFLTLEITESAMMENEARAMDLLTRLTSLGVRVAIDDFGTGYSSLTYLRKLPISELKIDKSFVIRMLQDHNDLSIVRSTIDLAHDLGMKVVAEGIEDGATLNELITRGCDTGQGYYFSQALGIERFIAWAKENAIAI